MQLPTITITPAPVVDRMDESSLSTTHGHGRRHSLISFSLPSLPVPPLAQAHDDRLVLAQAGSKVGSFRLNCVESAPGPLASLSPAATLATTRRVFSWNTTGATGPSPDVPMVVGRGGRSRHARAKSLNSLADFTLPTIASPSPAPSSAAVERRSRYMSGPPPPFAPTASIDLSILERLQPLGPSSRVPLAPVSTFSASAFSTVPSSPPPSTTSFFGSSFSFSSVSDWTTGFSRRLFST